MKQYQFSGSTISHLNYMMMTWRAESKRSNLLLAGIMAAIFFAMLVVLLVKGYPRHVTHRGSFIDSFINSVPGYYFGIALCVLSFLFMAYFLYMAFDGKAVLKNNNAALAKTRYLSGRLPYSSYAELDLSDVAAYRSCVYHYDEGDVRQCFPVIVTKESFVVNESGETIVFPMNAVYKVFRNDNYCACRVRRNGVWPYDIIMDLASLQGDTENSFWSSLEEWLPKNIVRYDRVMTPEETSAVKYNDAVHDMWETNQSSSAAK